MFTKHLVRIMQSSTVFTFDKSPELRAKIALTPINLKCFSLTLSFLKKIFFIEMNYALEESCLPRGKQSFKLKRLQNHTHILLVGNNKSNRTQLSKIKSLPTPK